MNASWPLHIGGERASIRAFVADVVEADWFEEAAQAISGRAAPCRLQDRLDEGDQGWWIVGDGEIVGALCGKLVKLPPPHGSRALVWTWLAVAAHWRAYGFGGAAVPLLELAGQRIGATTAVAPLPPDNGVALYFWLRLGYTPLRTTPVDLLDWPSGVASDALWMQRPLGSNNASDPSVDEE